MAFEEDSGSQSTVSIGHVRSAISNLVATSKNLVQKTPKRSLLLDKIADLSEIYARREDQVESELNRVLEENKSLKLRLAAKQNKAEEWETRCLDTELSLQRLQQTIEMEREDFKLECEYFRKRKELEKRALSKDFERRLDEAHMIEEQKLQKRLDEVRQSLKQQYASQLEQVTARLEAEYVSLLSKSQSLRDQQPPLEHDNSSLETELGSCNKDTDVS